MMSQPGKQIIEINILPNISRTKDNQAMKFGQLIEYNMRNISPEKSYTKWGGETIPRLFPEKSKLSISLDPKSKVLHSLFLFVCQVEGYQNILKLSCKPSAFASYNYLLVLDKLYPSSLCRSGCSTTTLLTFRSITPCNLFQLFLWPSPNLLQRSWARLSFPSLVFFSLALDAISAGI